MTIECDIWFATDLNIVCCMGASLCSGLLIDDVLGIAPPTPDAAPYADPVADPDC